VTFDVDAQLVETIKANARYCYEGYRALQPMEVEWAETGLVLADELREGNVHAGRGIREIVDEAYKICYLKGHGGLRYVRTQRATSRMF